MEKAKYSFVTLEKKRNILMLRMNRPPLNLLNRQMRLELESVVREVESNPDIYVIIITGNEKAFSAGWDIQECLDLNQRTGLNITVEAQRTFNAIDDFDRPVIAAISGWCLGGGIELAMACDIRIASKKSQIGEPGPNIGIFPNFGGTQRLLRLVGPDKAKELILTAKRISGEEAARIGLVNRVVSDNELMDEAFKVANEIIDGQSQIAVRAALEAIQHGYGLPLSEGLKVEASAFAKTCSTEDMHEGIRAFFEKRLPKFKNQ